MNASCEHFSEYFKEFGPNAFNIIHGIFSTCVSQEARRQKVSARVELIAILVIKIVFTISHFVIDSNQWENAWENWHNRSGARSYCLLLSNVFLLKNCFIKRKKKKTHYANDAIDNRFYFQAISCLCYTCGSSGPQLYSCLHCIFFGCKGQHIVDHLESKRHHIALELSFGMIYCHACRDFIYDPECYVMAEKHLRKEAR